MSQPLVIMTPEQLEQFSRNLLDQYASQHQGAAEQPRPEILTAEELSERLKISVSTMIRYRKKGKLPYISIGDTVRFELYSVIKALTKNK